MLTIAFRSDGTIRFITLPGTETTSKPTPISLSLNPTTYLGAVTGAFPGKPSDSYVGLQTTQGRVYVCSGFSELCKYNKPPFGAYLIGV
jgi:hypothetical protein